MIEVSVVVTDLKIREESQKSLCYQAMHFSRQLFTAYAQYHMQIALWMATWR